MSLSDKVDDERSTEEQIEPELPEAFLQIYGFIKRALEEHRIINSEEEEMTTRIDLVVTAVMRLSNQIVNINSDQLDIKAQIISSIKPEIEASLGPAMKNEAERIIGKILGMSESLKGSIIELKEFIRN